MSNKHNKELLNRNAWEQPEVEGVVENNKTDDGVRIVKRGALKVNDSADHS